MNIINKQMHQVHADNVSASLFMPGLIDTNQTSHSVSQPNDRRSTEEFEMSHSQEKRALKSEKNDQSAEKKVIADRNERLQRMNDKFNQEKRKVIQPTEEPMHMVVYACMKRNKDVIICVSSISIILAVSVIVSIVNAGY